MVLNATQMRIAIGEVGTPFQFGPETFWSAKLWKVRACGILVNWESQRTFTRQIGQLPSLLLDPDYGLFWMSWVRVKRLHQLEQADRPEGKPSYSPQDQYYWRLASMIFKATEAVIMTESH